jgi:hypothetical protein
MKIIFPFIFLLSFSAYAQNFQCSGSIEQKQTIYDLNGKVIDRFTNREFASGTAVYKKIPNAQSTYPPTVTIGYFNFNNLSVEVCYETSDKLLLLKQCNLSGVKLLPKSMHEGKFEKISGDFFYTAQYQQDKIFYQTNYYLKCK